MMFAEVHNTFKQRTVSSNRHISLILTLILFMFFDEYMNMNLSDYHNEYNADLKENYIHNQKSLSRFKNKNFKYNNVENRYDRIYSNNNYDASYDNFLTKSLGTDDRSKVMQHLSQNIISEFLTMKQSDSMKMNNHMFEADESQSNIGIDNVYRDAKDKFTGQNSKRYLKKSDKMMKRHSKFNKRRDNKVLAKEAKLPTLSIDNYSVNVQPNLQLIQMHNNTLSDASQNMDTSFHNAGTIIQNTQFATYPDINYDINANSSNYDFPILLGNLNSSVSVSSPSFDTSNSVQVNDISSLSTIPTEPLLENPMLVNAVKQPMESLQLLRNSDISSLLPDAYIISQPELFQPLSLNNDIVNNEQFSSDNYGENRGDIRNLQHNTNEATGFCYSNCSCWLILTGSISLFVLSCCSVFTVLYLNAALFSKGMYSATFYKGGGYWYISLAIIGLSIGILVGSLVTHCLSYGILLGSGLMALLSSIILIGKRGAFIGAFGGTIVGGTIGFMIKLELLPIGLGASIGLLIGIIIGFSPFVKNLKMNDRYIRRGMKTNDPANGVYESFKGQNSIINSRNESVTTISRHTYDFLDSDFGKRIASDTESGKLFTNNNLRDPRLIPRRLTSSSLDRRSSQLNA